MTSYLRTKGGGTAGRPKSRKLADLLRRQRHRCALCDEPLNAAHANLDHIIPRSKGGSSEQWNLRATHIRCNSRRGNRVEDSIDTRNAARLHNYLGFRA